MKIVTMDRTISIYLLVDPRPNKKKAYIGWAYTKNLRRRYKRHLKRPGKAHKGNWIRKLKKLGAAPTLRVLGEYPEAMWSMMERFWIAKYKLMGYELTNSTNGGDGILGHHHSVETKRKIGAFNKKKKVSKETRLRMRLAAQRNWRDPEYRSKVTAAIQLNAKKPEYRAKMSIANKGQMPWITGKKHTDETRTKISVANKGKPSPLRGRIGVCSKETLAKRSLSMRLRWKDPEYIKKQVAARKDRKCKATIKG